MGRKKREIADAILALTEETMQAEKKGITKREADAQITQNCAGSNCAQNNVGAGNIGISISQNCVGAACIQNNLLGRKRREIVDAINSLTEEVIAAEEAEKQEINKRESETFGGGRKQEVVAKLLEEAHKVAKEQAEYEALEAQSRKRRSFTHLLP